MTGSSGQSELDKVTLLNIKTKLTRNPSYQKQIATILSSIDSKIALNNRINAELEAMAKTVYDYWFVQFDFPFDFAQGKPSADGKPYKSSGGKMVWSEELKREVPEGWEVGELSDLAISIIRGISPKYIEDNGICVLNQKCIRDNSINYELSRRHDNKIKDASARFINYGDILVNSTGFGTLGRVAFVKWLQEESITVDSHVTIVRPNEKIINSEYLAYSVQYKQTEIENMAEGSTGQTELSRVKLGSLKVIIPSNELQQNFAAIVKPQIQKIANNQQENQQLSSLRDWLLPMLMNGQVKVGEVEEEVKTLMAAEVTPTYKLPARSNIPDNKRGFAKQVLGGKIVKEFKDDKNFTHIKFQKLQYLAEQIIEEDLNWNYYRQSAGPYDNKFMHSVFNRLEKNSWFRKRGDNYYPLEKMNDIDKYYQNYFGNKSEKLNNLFGLLQRGTEKFCEAVATIYAVWNNHIILKQEFDKERVKADFFDWSNRKTAVFTEEEFEKALFWMQNHDIVPTGFGGLIKEKK